MALTNEGMAMNDKRAEESAPLLNTSGVTRQSPETSDSQADGGVPASRPTAMSRGKKMMCRLHFGHSQ